MSVQLLYDRFDYFGGSGGGGGGFSLANEDFGVKIFGESISTCVSCFFLSGGQLAHTLLVSWRFEPGEPQRMTSGLNSNFTLSPSYSFHKSLYHKSLFLKPQLKPHPQFRNAKSEKQ